MRVRPAIELTAQNNNIESNQTEQHRELNNVPADQNLAVILEGTLISLLLPVAADGCCRSTGIGADQISGSNGASKIGALWQMLSLLATGKDAGVSTGCGCRPAGDLLAAFQIQSQCPAGVDSCDLAHGHPKASGDVLDYNNVFTHLNPGKPKEHQRAKDYGRNQGSARDNSRDSIGCKDAGQSQRHGNDYDYREVSRGLSNKNLHATSVAVKRRVCA